MNIQNSEQTLVDSFTYECQKQLRLKEQLESEGFVLADDPAGLYDKIGTVQELSCLCELYTPREDLHRGNRESCLRLPPCVTVANCKVRLLGA
jgi:hypothetical protein